MGESEGQFGTLPYYADENKKMTRIYSRESTYIMNVCTGRILIEDMSVNGYCFGTQPCLTYKSMAECYIDLKNGEIENLWSDLLDLIHIMFL